MSAPNRQTIGENPFIVIVKRTGKFDYPSLCTRWSLASISLVIDLPDIGHIRAQMAQNQALETLFMANSTIDVLLPGRIR